MWPFTALVDASAATLLWIALTGFVLLVGLVLWTLRRRQREPGDAPLTFELWRDEGRRWNWRLVHRSGRCLAESPESFYRRRQAEGTVRDIIRQLQAGEYDVDTTDDARVGP